MGEGVGVGSGVGVGVAGCVASTVGTTSSGASVATGAAATGVEVGTALTTCVRAGNSSLAKRNPSTKPMTSAIRKHQPHILRYFALILRSTLRIIAARALLSNKTAP